MTVEASGLKGCGVLIRNIKSSLPGLMMRHVDIKP